MPKRKKTCQPCKKDGGDGKPKEEAKSMPVVLSLLFQPHDSYGSAFAQTMCGMRRVVELAHGELGDELDHDTAKAVLGNFINVFVQAMPFQIKDLETAHEAIREMTSMCMEGWLDRVLEDGIQDSKKEAEEEKKAAARPN